MQQTWTLQIVTVEAAKAHRSFAAALNESAAQRPHLGEEVEARGVVAAAVHGVNREEAVGGLDEEAAQALHHAGADPDVGAPPIELRLQLRGAQQRRLQEEVVPAHTYVVSAPEPELRGASWLLAPPRQPLCTAGERRIHESVGVLRDPCQCPRVTAVLEQPQLGTVLSDGLITVDTRPALRLPHCERDLREGIAALKWHLGRITSTMCPCSCTALPRAVTTSPRPPTLQMGAISTATCTTCSPGGSSCSTAHTVAPLLPPLLTWPQLTI